MLKTTQGPINANALIVYCNKNKQYAKALKQVTELYKKTKRKYTNLNYVSHALTVGTTALTLNLSPEAMILSALEDVTAKAKLDSEKIGELYGLDIQKAVHLITPVLDEQGLINMPLYINNLKCLPPDMQTIKLISLLDHVAAIPKNKLKENTELFDNARLILESLDQGNEQIKSRLLRLLRKYQLSI